MARVARETSVATQMGNQGHSTDTMRDTVELLQAGAIGPVREVHAWVNAGRWNPTLMGRPTDTQLVPAGVNWDLWLGPRDPRPFHTAYFPVSLARLLGVRRHEHRGLRLPRAGFVLLGVRSRRAGERRVLTRRHDERGDRAAWLPWRIQVRRARQAAGAVAEVVRRRPAAGGARGIARGETADPARRAVRRRQGRHPRGGAGGTPTLLPESKFKGYAKPKPTLARSKGHHRDWLDACKGGAPASSNFEYGARLTELALLGALALRLGRRVDWDAERMEARGISEAEPIIREPYRAGWELGE